MEKEPEPKPEPIERGSDKNMAKRADTRERVWPASRIGGVHGQS